MGRTQRESTVKLPDFGTRGLMGRELLRPGSWEIVVSLTEMGVGRDRVSLGAQCCLCTGTSTSTQSIAWARQLILPAPTPTP